jgi:hypothetical protein
MGKVMDKVMDIHIHRRIHTHILTRANATVILVLARINITQATLHARHLATILPTIRPATRATIRTPARAGLAQIMIAVHAQIAVIQAEDHIQFQLRTENTLKGTAGTQVTRSRISRLEVVCD